MDMTKKTKEQLIEELNAARQTISRLEADRINPATDEYLQDLMSTLSDAVFTIKMPERKITYVNIAIQDVFGCLPEEVIGQSTRRFYPDEEAFLAFGRELEQAISEGVNLHTEQEFCKKNGDRFHADMTVNFRYKDEQLVEVISVVRDISEKKRTEETLRRSERLLKEAQHTAHVGSWIWHVKSNSLEWSDEMYNIFGIDKEYFSGLLPEVIEKAIHPDDKAKVEASNISVVQQNKPIPVEYRIVRPDGSIRIVRGEAGELVLDEQGKPHILTGIVADITEYKQAEEALRQSESRYKGLVENIPAILYEFSDKSGGLYYSPQVERILGYSPEYLKQHPMLWHDSIHPEDVYKVDEAIRTVDHTPISIDYRIKDASGNWRWFHDYSIEKRNNAEEVIIVGISSDITGHRRSEQFAQIRLRLSDYALTHSVTELMQKSLDEAESLTDSHIGFFHLLEADQRILTLQAWSTNTLTNMCSAEGEGQHYPVDSAGVWVDCIRERRPVIHNDYEHLLHKQGLPEGHAAVHRELVVPIIRNDLIVAIIGVGNKPGDYDDIDIEMISQLGDTVWEIISRKKTEIDLRHSQEIIELKDRFMSIVSHEFRTPLAVIQSSNDLLSNYLDRMTPERRERSLQQISQQVKILTGMIDDIGAIGRAKAGRIDFYPSATELASFCRTIVEQIEFADNQKHQFEFINHASDIQVMVDANLLRHILTNLLSNATKYSPENSRITFEINHLDQFAQIRVSDDGIGIPEEDKAFLFDPFHRAKNVGKVKGTGLGLSIVKEYVELHGGRINVISQIGEGSTFEMLLPLE